MIFTILLSSLIATTTPEINYNILATKIAKVGEESNLCQLEVSTWKQLCAQNDIRFSTEDIANATWNKNICVLYLMDLDQKLDTWKAIVPDMSREAILLGIYKQGIGSFRKNGFTETTRRYIDSVLKERKLPKGIEFK